MVKKVFLLSLISNPPSLSQTLLTISCVFFQRMFSHTHTCVHVHMCVSLLTGRVAGNANGGLLYLAMYFNDHALPVSTSFTSSFEQLHSSALHGCVVSILMKNGFCKSPQGNPQVDSDIFLPEIALQWMPFVRVLE